MRACRLPEAAAPGHSRRVKLSVAQDFPATPDVMWSVFSDRNYPPAKYTALGATHFEMARFSASADEISIDLSRKIPINLDKIPSFARKFIGDEQTMRHETHWRRVSADKVIGRLTITPVGRPVKITGEATLTPRGDGQSRLSIEFDVTSDVPLIGGKIAKVFAEQIEAALGADHAFTLSYLQRAS